MWWRKYGDSIESFTWTLNVTKNLPLLDHTHHATFFYVGFRFISFILLQLGTFPYYSNWNNMVGNGDKVHSHCRKILVVSIDKQPNIWIWWCHKSQVFSLNRKLLNLDSLNYNLYRCPSIFSIFLIFNFYQFFNLN